MPLVAADQVTGHAEDDVRFKILVILDEDLGNQGLEARLVGEDVEVRGTVGMAALRPQEIANRAVGCSSSGSYWTGAPVRKAWLASDEGSSMPTGPKPPACP